MLIKNIKSFKIYTCNIAQKAYDNSRIIREGYKLGKASAKPVLEMKSIYKENLQQGRINALKAIVKKKGFFGAAFTGIGALIGTFISVIPGTGLIGAVGGYFTGHGIDICSKQIYKTISKLSKR